MTTIKLSPDDIFCAARIRAVNRCPYLSHILFSLRPAKREIGTMAVDTSWRLWWDEKKVEEWGVLKTSVVLVHETMHVLRDHFERFKYADDPIIANLAGDCAINDDLRDIMNIPEMVKPCNFGLKDCETEEYYYKEIKKQSKDRTKEQDEKAPGCGGKCGSGAGNKHSWENDEPKDAPPKIGKHEQELTRRLVAHDIKEYAKSRGDVPAGFSLWADQILKPPTIPWQQVIRRYIRASIADESGMVDFSYKRMSRRQYGIAKRVKKMPILPSMRKPIPDVGVVLDTSGSMSGNPLIEAMSEIIGIVKATGNPIKVYATDAALHAKVMVQKLKDVEKTAVGGGGTDMCIGIDAAIKDKKKIVIVLTDGLTPWPEKPIAGVKLIAAITPITPKGKSAPKFIQQVKIGD